MAVLSDADRQTVWSQFMQQGSGEALAVMKADGRAAVDAIDGWCEANAAAFNTAIPQPARGALTSRQKALLLAGVATMRGVRA